MSEATPRKGSTWLREKWAALTGLVSILAFIAPFSLMQGRSRNQCVNTKFTRPVSEIRKSSGDRETGRKL